MTTILQINESDFRMAGKHTDRALSYVKECKELITKNVMTIKTNLMFDLNAPEIRVLNQYLQILKSQNIIAVQILLD